jgi:hypothetical protein
MGLKNVFGSKRRVAAAVGAAALLAAAGGIAAAVFTTTASGTGAGHVGTAPAALTVTPVTAAGTLTPPSTPGQKASQVLTYTVHNTTGTHTVTITTTDHHTFAAVVSSTPSHDIITGTLGSPTHGNTIPSCKASWFTVTNPPSFSGSTIGAGGPVDAYVTLNMPYNAATQNACATKHPEVTLTVKAYR